MYWHYGGAADVFSTTTTAALSTNPLPINSLRKAATAVPYDFGNCGWPVFLASATLLKVVKWPQLEFS
jgi:hypothetical protein